MKTGIIGAGRVGCSLGKYFRSKNADLVGYYDTNTAAAKEAAAFTQTAGFNQVQQLVRESDILFITTPDSLLVPVWEEIKGMSHRNQIICHCSGALSSDSFSGAKEAGVPRIRIHDIRHSAVSLLIDMGFSATAIADRVGHESIDITYNYAHLFPSKQAEMADKLDMERGEV